MLEVTLLQRLLFAEVGQTLVVLHLCHADGGTSHQRQHVGAHLRERPRHVAQLVAVLHARPFVLAVGQILIVVLTGIVAGVEQVLKIIETDGINREFLLLCQHVH